MGHMKTPVQNIVFDWNCTLLDDFDAMHECNNLIMQRIGRAPVTQERFREHYDVPLDRFYRGLGFGEDEIAELLVLDKDVFHHQYESRADMAKLRDGAAAILGHTQAEGLRHYILSNHILDPIRRQLTRLGIDHFFAAVLAYAHRGAQFRDMTKGEKLRRFMEEKRLDPQATMIVGDSVEEIHIAREQGLVSVAITGGCASERRLRAEKPDHVIHSLHELKPILEQRGFAS